MAAKKKAKKKAAKKKPEDLTTNELTEKALEEAEESDESAPEKTPEAEAAPAAGVPEKEYVTVRGKGIGCKRMLKSDYVKWRKKQNKK